LTTDFNIILSIPRFVNAESAAVHSAESAEFEALHGAVTIPVTIFDYAASFRS
jgi:hypothetical protein